MDWKLFVQLLGALLVAALGWLVVHYLTTRRDLANERRKLRIAYLLEAYRRLEAAANRQTNTPEEGRAFEAAVADIQLLGTQEQAQVTIEFLKQRAAGEGALIDGVLRVLRKDLRREMGLAGDIENGVIFRFVEPKSPKKDAAQKR